MFKGLIREPLVHFLVIGLLLFALYRVIGEDRAENNKILVTESVLAGLAQQFSASRQRAPSPKELQGLVDAWVREEVLYREGLEMGLDRDDQVIRRRISQRVGVLAEESQAGQEATDAELAVWLKNNQARYALPAVLSFEQIMLDPANLNGDVGEAAERMKNKLARGMSPEDLSESHLLPVRIESVPENLAARDFGEEFIAALRDLPIGSWQGPIRSGYGLHLVKINARIAGRAATLDEARTALARDVELDRRTRAAQAFYTEAKRKYDIRIMTAPDSGAQAK